MGNLVWKDLVIGKWFWVAAVPIYTGQLAAVSDTTPAFLLLTILGTAFFMFVSIGIEEMQGTEVLWNSLPVSRGQVVGARYLASMLGLAFGLGVSWIVALTVPPWFIPGAAESAVRLGSGAYLGLACVLLILASVFLPCLFRYGFGGGLQAFAGIGIGGLLLVLIVASAVTFMAGGADALAALRSPGPDQIAAAERWLDAWGAALPVALAGAALLITAWSAMLSVQFYNVRD